MDKNTCPKTGIKCDEYKIFNRVNKLRKRDGKQPLALAYFKRCARCKFKDVEVVRLDKWVR